MIDLNRLRQEPEKVKELILRKDPSFPVDQLIEQDKKKRTLLLDVETLRKEKNSLATSGAKNLTPELREKSISIGKDLKIKEDELAAIDKPLHALLASVPNLPYETLPLGGKEANKPVKEVGSKREFDFPFKNHMELNETLKWFDLTMATGMSGSQFVLYRGLGAKIIYALTRLMLKNNVKHGFEPVVPPYLVTEQALYNAGELPKFEGAYYKIEADKLCLIPTSEVALTNMYANSILSTAQLPMRMTSWTSCFRREAGGYGATERGLIRIHQFEKVELYSICTPETSDTEQERMLACAENILQMLGLHYRVSLLATQDCSFQSARTYDLEVWLPGQDRYYEVSSCSNCTDFQARRAQIRHRIADDQKPSLVHTLNASSLALPRLMVALMENYQQADGSVKLPAVLEEEMNTVW